ncbi:MULTISPECIES: MarR family winged helix-turn-helix transcriptional regulator [Anoxybacillus]|uniref:MarR family transcriptional regulator n=1 Tax=Anoxybacillus flavithermus AK1 TaxID=1297581 RepID=M8DYD7_9BACL|nr:MULTISPECIES: MarR family transcriptional regulator [Anoxybacillus]EMT45769.1 MarR family transcriptional regulator [Anoxybacillus flavithermus AK1]KHF29663.1 HTH-type transcriptional regulator MhqR [Anoxybacillus sp. BCO1]MBW7651944.1 MarR family transcriptional regulator [Anoxybacillus sp. ST4]
MNQNEQTLSLKLFVVLSRAHKAVSEHVKHDIQRYGLNPTEFGVLDLLYHKGAQPIQQIGDKILLTSGSMTYVIDKLEEKGYIVRQRCEKDRRITYAVITDEGKALMDHIFPQHAQKMSDIFRSLSTEEKELAIHLLKKIGLSLSPF